MKSVKFILVLLGVLIVFGLRMVIGAETDTCSYHAAAYQGLDHSRLKQELAETGLVGRMHGAAASQQLFVLSLRDPNNFFSHEEISLIPSTEPIRSQLSRMHRHDQVCVQGHFMDNSSPQKHLVVEAVNVQEPWNGLQTFPRLERQAELPQNLANRGNFVGKVHAIGAEGKVLVVESQDRILPIYVTSPDTTQGLYRGDLVQINYQLQKQPRHPAHLRLDPEAKQPLQVLDAIATWQNKSLTLTGSLVKFPQSPQIKLDVYAIEVETLGIKRTFTLVNFDNPETFQQIQAKLADIWNKNQKTARKGRNMLINPNVAIAATGRINIVSRQQANPQILLDSVNSLDVQFSQPKR